MRFEGLDRLLNRLGSYPLWETAVELGVIFVVVYAVFRFVRGTRAAGALKGTLVLLVLATLLVRVLGSTEAFARLNSLYESFLTFLAITLIVVFQPELRRGLIRLGEAPILRRSGVGAGVVVDAIVDCCAYLSRAKFGGLIVVEREVKLRGLVEGGTELHARVSSRLLKTVFFPGSALHDLAVVIGDGEIRAAGVQLPLADPEDMPDPSLGSRHRAAVGLSKECDAVIVVVSEETGTISLAEYGRLRQGLSPESLRMELHRLLVARAEKVAASRAEAAGVVVTGEVEGGEVVVDDGAGDGVGGAELNGAAKPAGVLGEKTIRKVG
ncbi:MAG: diadenylate cyclase [Phycisphaeraceae bacterium]|nr:diadenylate cyclase [Phycisphaeraceae bacterium]